MRDIYTKLNVYYRKKSIPINFNENTDITTLLLYYDEPCSIIDCDVQKIHKYIYNIIRHRLSSRNAINIRKLAYYLLIEADPHNPLLPLIIQHTNRDVLLAHLQFEAMDNFTSDEPWLVAYRTTCLYYICQLIQCNYCYFYIMTKCIISNINPSPLYLGIVQYLRDNYSNNIDVQNDATLNDLLNTTPIDIVLL